MSNTMLTRRNLLKGLTIATGAVGLAACAPKVIKETVVVTQEKVVKEVVKETVVVKEAVEVEKEVTRVVEKQAEPAPAGPVVLRYASWWTQGNEDIIMPGLEQLQDLVSGLKLEIEDSTPEKLLTMFVAGTSADVLLHDNDFSKYVDGGFLLQLDDNYAAEGLDYDEDFYHGLGIDRWLGKLYGFPYMFNSCLMLYNKTMIQKYWGKDLWEAFPDGMWDHQDFLEVARACTQDLDGDGRIDQWGMYMFHRDYYYGMETEGWTRGDSVFDLENVRYNFTSETMREVSHDLLSWVRNEQICVGEEDAAEINKASGANAPFYAGFVGMRIRMSPDVGRGLQVIGDKFDWDLMYLPNNGDNLAVTRAGGHGQNIYTKTKVKDAAWQFVKFYGTTPGQTFMAQTKAGLPTYRDPELREIFEVGTPPHDNVLLGVCEDRGGYGDHMRFHTEVECRRLYANEMDLLYNKPYDEAAKELDGVMTRLETDMNDLVDYGDTLPYPGIKFPFKTIKR